MTPIVRDGGLHWKGEGRSSWLGLGRPVPNRCTAIFGEVVEVKVYMTINQKQKAIEDTAIIVSRLIQQSSLGRGGRSESEP